MKMYGTVEAARIIEERTGCKCSRDQLYMNILRAGCPDASATVSGRKAFTMEDIEAIIRWCRNTGRYIRETVGA